MSSETQSRRVLAWLAAAFIAGVVVSAGCVRQPDEIILESGAWACIESHTTHYTSFTTFGKIHTYHPPRDAVSCVTWHRVMPVLDTVVTPDHHADYTRYREAKP